MSRLEYERWSSGDLPRRLNGHLDFELMTQALDNEPDKAKRLAVLKAVRLCPDPVIEPIVISEAA